MFDGSGEIRLDDGTVVRFALPALRGLAAAIGKQVTVLAFARHPHVGFEATAIAPATVEPTPEVAAALGAVSWQDAALAAVTHEPLTEGDERYFAKRAASREAAAAAEVASMTADREAFVRKAGPGPASWTKRLRAAGVPRAQVARIVAIGRPAARIVALPAPTPVACAHSKFGGVPDLPPGFVWPRHEGRPLSFLAQIRITELPVDVRASLALPPDGLLSFFYDQEEQPWGFEPTSDRGGAVLVLSRDHGALAPTAPPADLDEEWRVPERRARFVEELRLPAVGTPSLDALGLDARTLAAYDDALEGFADEPEVPHHLVGGHAMTVQGAMEVDAALHLHGISTGEPVDAARPDVARARATAWDMRLVLQIDTDELQDLMWGDMGRLYVWIREADLRAHAFDRAWCILQCH